jgi:hypothetical protein
MNITLTRSEAQQVLDALQEINKLSIGENAICLPAEIDDAMETLRARLAQPEPRQTGDSCLFHYRIQKAQPEQNYDIGDRFAHRLAIMLECSLLDPVGTYNDACALLDEYHQALRNRDDALGLPYVSGFGKD